MNKKSLFPLILLVALLLVGISPAYAAQGLRIAPLIFNDVDIMTLVPFELSAVIYNNDSVGHYYTLWVMLDADYDYTVNGYVNADSWQNVFLYLIPSQVGEKSVEVRLYQDSPATSAAPWTDMASITVNVGKGPLHTAYDNLNTEVNSLKTDVSELKDLTNRLTYAIIILSTVAAVFAIISLGLIINRRYHQHHDITLYQKQ